MVIDYLAENPQLIPEVFGPFSENLAMLLGKGEGKFEGCLVVVWVTAMDEDSKLPAKFNNALQYALACAKDLDLHKI